MDFSGNIVENDKVFVFVFGDEWEDTRIILSEHEAIEISKNIQNTELKYLIKKLIKKH